MRSPNWDSLNLWAALLSTTFPDDPRPLGCREFELALHLIRAVKRYGATNTCFDGAVHLAAALAAGGLPAAREFYPDLICQMELRSLG